MALNILNFDKFSKDEIDERVDSLANAEPYTQAELGAVECDNMFAGM